MTMLRKFLDTFRDTAAGEPQPAASPAAAGTVLIADDDPLLRELLETALTRHHYRVVAVENGRLAYETACKLRPDAVILDGQMPEMDGFEALKQLRRTRQTARIPVIMLTMRDRQGDMLTGFRYGAHEYLTKPVTIEEVLNSLKRLLEHRR
jgi:DNA-binding response OmpR family regulator